MQQAIPFQQRLTCRIDEAAMASGLSALDIASLIKKNEIATTLVEERILIVVPSLVARLWGSDANTQTDESRPWQGGLRISGSAKTRISVDADTVHRGK